MTTDTIEDTTRARVTRDAEKIQRQMDSNEDAGLNLLVKQHRVGFFVPPGMKLHASEIQQVDFGILVAGELEGEVICTEGSIIITETGLFRGNAQAENVFVSGRIDSTSAGKRSQILARKMFASSKTAQVNAILTAYAFAVHRSKMTAEFHNLESID